MLRKVIYWMSTGLLAALSIFAAFTYLAGNPQAVQGFAHVGYPQQLRVILGVAKLLGAITLVAPGLPRIKEWAYAGFTFAWISASVAHYLAKDGPKAFTPLILLVFLFVSYVTRPASRQWQPKREVLYLKSGLRRECSSLSFADRGLVTSNPELSDELVVIDRVRNRKASINRPDSRCSDFD